MLVRDVMTDRVQSAHPNTPVADAAEILFENEIRHLPVVEEGQVVGILSDRDLRSLAMPRLVDQETLQDLRRRYHSPVSELMSPDPIKVHPETSLGEVIDEMTENKISALPVVDPSTGALLGIVSTLDVLRALRDRAEG